MVSTSDREAAMNAFYEHHRDSIRFGYRCFDRILLNGLIQPFQQPERVVGFFDTYRQLYPVSRDVLRGAAEQFQGWVKEEAARWNAPVVEAPKGRRDEFVEPYFGGAEPDQVVVILKAREPARIMTAIGDRKANRWHLQIADRWVVQYNFYINDLRWGRMFVRICPYLPFSARVCLNQHHWLANRMREEHIDFQQCSNAFLRCGTPERLQQLADTLTADDLSSCGQKWLARFTPFFSERERRQAGCQHRLFFSQIVEHLPALRDKLAAIDDSYLDIQQDILETFVHRGHLQRLAKPTLTPSGKRVPGLKLDNPRQLAMMHALVRFAQIPAANTFSTGEIHPYVAAALSDRARQYGLAALRYDLSKLRAKGLVEKLPCSRRYRLPAQGYSVCLIFLKLFDRVYAPLTAGLLAPVPGDIGLPKPKRSRLDQLYQWITDSLDRLLSALGIAFPPSLNANKIPVEAPITA